MARGWFACRPESGDKAESRFPQIAGAVSAVAWLGVAGWLSLKHWL